LIGPRQALRACAALVAYLALATSPAAAQNDIAHAQPPLRIEPLEVVTHSGVHRFRVEIAATPRQQEIGLMFRPRMAAGHGMLFELGRPQEAKFWMKNCPAPLDMLFIRADGRILSIAANTTPYSEQGIDSGGAVTGVLELRGGRAAEIDAEPGDRVRHRYFHDE
jgi:uncharacterized membrane protein (UPF0127 family)